MPGVSYFVVARLVLLPGQTLQAMMCGIPVAVVWFVVWSHVALDPTRGDRRRSISPWVGVGVLALMALVAAIAVPVRWTLPSAATVAWWFDARSVERLGVDRVPIERGSTFRTSAFYVRAGQEMDDGSVELDLDGAIIRARGGVERFERVDTPGAIDFITFPVSREWWYVSARDRALRPGSTRPID
jgi:hypothetical protein